jgi:pimeloyl-ACP methyl ester carboxylesterase
MTSTTSATAQDAGHHDGGNQMSTLNVDGTSIRVFRTGRGDARTVVYLPSILGEVCATPFVDQLGAARPDTSILTAEYPGCGGSSAPASEWRSVHDAVFHLGRTLDALSTEPVVLVGPSLGGWLAAEVAAWFPTKVSALVLVNAFGIRLAEAPMKSIFEQTGASDLKGLFNSRANPNGLDLAALVSPSINPAEVGDQHALYLHLLRVQALAARIGFNPLMHDPRLRERLRCIDCPTLVVWGEKDGLMPVAYGEAFTSAIVGAELHRLPEAGHFPLFDDPAGVAKLVSRFLSKA